MADETGPEAGPTEGEHEGGGRPAGTDPGAAPDDTARAETAAAREAEELRALVAASRRGALKRVGIAAAAAMGAVLVVPWLAFMLWPVLRTDPRVWRRVGAVHEFPVGTTRLVRYLDPDPLPWAGFAAASAAWVRRDAEDEFVAFTVYCTHVGCPVRWDAGAELFMCPCHGGAFFGDGRVAAGPPPRPLDRYPIRVVDGQVEVRTVGVPVPRGLL